VEIRQGIFDVAKWPLTTAINLGSFVLEVTGREDTAYRLQVQEPISRAFTALHSATRAIRKNKPDQTLARFEVMRAANAVNDLTLMDPELAAEIGHEVVEAALELPDNEINYKIVEQVTETSLEKLVRYHIPYEDLPKE
jgi:hypothetical protein